MISLANVKRTCWGQKWKQGERIQESRRREQCPGQSRNHGRGGKWACWGRVRKKSGRDERSQVRVGNGEHKTMGRFWASVGHRSQERASGLVSMGRGQAFTAEHSEFKALVRNPSPDAESAIGWRSLTIVMEALLGERWGQRANKNETWRIHQEDGGSIFFRLEGRQSGGTPWEGCRKWGLERAVGDP